MCNIKKVILSISISFIMLGALIMSIYLNSNKSLKTSTSTETLFKNVEETNQIYYAANEISVKKGSSQLDYTYIPDSNLKEGEDSQTKTIAYEYIFTNTMDKTTGINLKDIDTTGVKVSYLYSNQPIDTEKSHTADTEFELRKLSADETLYIYIIVSPLDDTTPTTFNPNVVWYYGIPQTISVVNTATNTKETKTIINGQELDVLYEDVVVPNGYYFDSWFKDEDCTQPITTNVGNAEATLHVRLANLPSDWLKLNGSEYYVATGTSTLPENLVIPNYYNGKPVTQISTTAFKDNTTIKSVAMPSTIKTLGSESFRNCSQLTSIDISKSLESMRSGIFYSCTSLKEVVLPDNLSYFSANGTMFYECSSLTRVVLPQNLTSIPARMFSYCTNLVEVNIPKSITSIGSAAFRGCEALKKLDLSNYKNLTTIDTYAFYESSGITEIDLTGCVNLTTIGEHAFAKCTSLLNMVGFNTCVNITTMGKSIFSGDTSLVSVGEINRLTKLTVLPRSIFYECTSLIGTVILPPNITEIGAHVFYSCKAINEIVMPNKVTTIGINAFRGCTSLTSVNISNKVTAIEEGVFASTKITNINIPAGVTSIGPRAFAYCPSLVSADLTNCTNITSIGEMAFYNCKLLTTIGDISRFTDLTTIPDNVFYSCEKLTNIGDLSKLTKLESIGEQAFYYCSGLTGDITLSATITKIGQRAFRGTGYTTIKLTNTSGWYYTSNTDYTGGTLFEDGVLDDVATCTDYLKNSYYTYYWRNGEE